MHSLDIAEVVAALPQEMRADVPGAIAADPDLSTWWALTHESSWSRFEPRPDTPEQFDEQYSFCTKRDPVAFLVGGNASGTTTAAAWKCAHFVLKQQVAPRRDTPFWIIAEDYDQCQQVCWVEKLYGQRFIPDCEVEWERVRWRDSKQGLPLFVPLKPRPESPDTNWAFYFKSYKQGRRSMQARSIGGFWFSEQFPLAIFLEVLRGCRDCMFPGGQFAEFTPIDPELCVWVEKVMEDPPEGWRFYRCNTELNKGNLAEGWYDQFFATVPDEMMATRKTGALASFEGVIYPSFNPAVHVDEKPFLFPPNVTHMRGIDWGASEEHPQVCIWGYVDGMGDWFIYDEYWSPSQTMITFDHAVEVMARSIAWGWPPPREVWERDEPIAERFCELVAERLAEIDRQAAVWLERWCRDMAGTPAMRPLDKFAYTFADPARPGEMTEFTKWGITCAPASNAVYEGINCVRSLLKLNPKTGKPRIYIHPRCIHLIEELRKYRWKRRRALAETSVIPLEAPKPEPLKKDDDCADALRYLVFSPTRQLAETPDSLDHREIPVTRRQSVQLERSRDRGRLSR